METLTEQQEQWVVLSGCNACINFQLCHHLETCALLHVDIMYPANDKRKRNYIKKLRSGITRPDLYAQQMKMELVNNWPEPSHPPRIWPNNEGIKYKHTKVSDNRTGYRMKNAEKTYRTWDGPIKLTTIEKMCIESLNKPRGNGE